MFVLPILTARAIYRPAVRDSPVDTHRQKKAPTFWSRLLVFALPIFTTRAIYRPAVRDSPVDCPRQNYTCRT